MPASWIVIGISVAYLAASLVVGMWPGRKASGTAAGFVAVTLLGLRAERLSRAA